MLSRASKANINCSSSVSFNSAILPPLSNSYSAYQFIFIYRLHVYFVVVKVVDFTQILIISFRGGLALESPRLLSLYEAFTYINVTKKCSIPINYTR